jgi:hypothetical protein
MSNIFAYSLLKYRHSASAGEVLNVGLLVVFPDKVVFKYPKNAFSRIKSAYPDTKVEHLKKYLMSFGKAAKSKKSVILSGNIHAESDLLKLQNDFLVRDDSSLFFDVWHKSVLYSQDYASILENLLRDYFFVTDNSEQKNAPENILSKVKDLILQKDAAVYRKFFEKSAPEIIETEKTKWVFDTHWQNGSLHLVQPVDFSLKAETFIVNKSFELFGKIYHTTAKLKEMNAELDLLVYRPTDKNLENEYLKAADILKSCEPVNLYTQFEFEEYAQKVVRELSGH